jgi:ribulose-phosphate 3-epimerase
MIKIAPSILSADFGILAEEIARVEAAGADQLHIDVMDGRFVPNITMGFPILDAIRKRTRLPLDLHLMIVEPEKYLAEFAARGADMLTVHVEACPHLQRTLVGIRELSARRGAPVRSGAALNPSTHPSTLDYVLDDLDLVLVMSVNPGFGGQKFIPTALRKLREARQRIDASGCNVRLEIDGGVKVDNIGEIARAGADMFVAGSAIFGAKDYQATISAMRAAIQPPKA